MDFRMHNPKDTICEFRFGKVNLCALGALWGKELTFIGYLEKHFWPRRMPCNAKARWQNIALWKETELNQPMIYISPAERVGKALGGCAMLTYRICHLVIVSAAERTTIITYNRRKR